MARKYFVDAHTKRIDLSEGDWIEVRNELSYGENLRLSTAIMDRIENEEGTTSMRPNMLKFRAERMISYIKEWSVKLGNGATAKVNRQMIEDLDEDFADEIDAALDAHVEELTKVKKAQKEQMTNVSPTKS